MKTYRPGMAPAGMKDAPEVRALANYTQSELQGIAQAAQRADPSVTWQYLHVEPVRYSPGDVVLADGTDWNPGSGAGLYRRSEDNTAWVFAGNNVTDLATTLHAATSKTPPVDADEIPLVDSAASYVLKKLTWANLKAAMWTAWGALIAAGTGKTTPVDGDSMALSDSAASDATKKLTWANLKATLKTYFDTLYAVLTAAQTFTAAQRGAFSTLTDGSTVTPDFSLANQYILNIGGNRTLGVPTNIVKGQQGVIIVRQDTTGSRTLAYAWIYEWFGGSAGVLSTPGCSRDMLAYSVDAYNSAAVTITIATPGVVTFTAHGFLTGQRCQITTTGALPTGLTASTTYFISKVDADSFKLCTTLANAAAGTFIATSGSQSGVHTLTGGSITLQLSKAAA